MKLFRQAHRRESSFLLSRFGEGAECASRDSNSNAADFLRLKIDSELSSSGDIRVASRVSGRGSATGEGAYSAHN